MAKSNVGRPPTREGGQMLSVRLGARAKQNLDILTKYFKSNKSDVINGLINKSAKDVKAKLKALDENREE